MIRPLLIALTFILAPSAYAQSSAESPIKSATVLIQGSVDGSGVIVKGPKGGWQVLTAWHVVAPNKDGEEISIKLSNGRNDADIRDGKSKQYRFSLYLLR